MKARRFISSLLALSFVLSAASCKFMDLDLPEDRLHVMAGTIVEALEDEDGKSIENLFSDYALDHIDDMDEGLDYLFDLYDGGTGDIHDEDIFRTPSTFENGGRKQWCVFRVDFDTDEEDYVLYGMFIYDWPDDSRQGLYSLGLCKADDFDYDHYRDTNAVELSIAGIDYPDRQTVNDVRLYIEDLRNIGLEGDGTLSPDYVLVSDDQMEDLFTTDFLNDLSEDELLNIRIFFTDSWSIHVNDMWVTTGRGYRCLYIETDYGLDPCIWGLRIEDSNGKISGMILTDDLDPVDVDEGVDGFDGLYNDRFSDLEG